MPFTFPSSLQTLPTAMITYYHKTYTRCEHWGQSSTRHMLKLTCIPQCTSNLQIDCLQLSDTTFRIFETLQNPKFPALQIVDELSYPLLRSWIWESCQCIIWCACSIELICRMPRPLLLVPVAVQHSKNETSLQSIRISEMRLPQRISNSAPGRKQARVWYKTPYSPHKLIRSLSDSI